jgi:2-aminoadipate transaminase
VGIRWQELTARCAPMIHDSIVIPFHDLPKHPDPIAFNGGTPSPECLPIEYLRDCIYRAWDISHDTLYYGDSEGYLPLRERIVERMHPRGVQVDPDQLMVTNGAQQALDLVSRVLLDPGDTVIVEAPTYFGALQVFDMYQARYQSVEMDGGGMIPESLEEAIRRAERPKFIYTIPTYQNPTGFTVATERRSRLIEIADRFNVPIVEDDPYGELWFGETGQNPLRADGDDVIYLGTFSKTIAPALRMGWVTAPSVIMEKLLSAKEATDIGSDRMVQRMVVLATDDGWLDSHLDTARANYEQRYHSFVRALEREMPGDVTWSTPDGGFFIWVSLAEECDSFAMLHDSAVEGALYLPGSIFYADQRRSPSFRLGFTTLPIERYVEGIARMGRAFRTALGRA